MGLGDADCGVISRNCLRVAGSGLGQLTNRFERRKTMPISGSSSYSGIRGWRKSHGLTPKRMLWRFISTSRPRDAMRVSFWVRRVASPDCTVRQ